MMMIVSEMASILDYLPGKCKSQTHIETQQEWNGIDRHFATFTNCEGVLQQLLGLHINERRVTSH